MAIYSYKKITPKIPKSCFVAKSADIIGDVTLGDNANIWFQTVIRGDDAPISIGKNVNVQDLCMLHVIQNGPLIIKDNVSIGHSVTLHACTVEEGCLIGMGATVLDGAHISKNSIVAAGSTVSPGKKFPEGVMLMGTPARVVRELSAQEIEKCSNHYKMYLDQKDVYQDSDQFEELQGES